MLMPGLQTPLIFCFFFILLTACKKTQIIEVPVEKKNSWSEVKGFSGTQRVFLSSGSDSSQIFLQHPGFFTSLQPEPVTGINLYDISMPTDVKIRIPISSAFFAYPYGDMAIMFRNNRNPILSPSKGYFNLQQIDPSLTKIRTDFMDVFKCFAINKNNELIVNYYTNTPGEPYTFMVIGIQTYSSYPSVDTTFCKKVSIPKNLPIGGVRSMTAIHDYFLVEIFPDGLFKIKSDGSYSKVYSSPAHADAIYEWNGKIYAHQEWQNFLVSSDNGENWQQFNGNSEILTNTKYYKIKDSLVGTFKDKIFTLSWSDNSYTIRLVKADGLEGTVINGIEILNDMIYTATTSGLYRKPVTSFFESP
jgi:hypothetical protein